MPSHEVIISKPFFISKYEVTQGQWKQIIESDPSVFDGDNLPVENVNWFDTFRFTDALSETWGVKYRLPTEAEWEYCARAGSSTIFGLGKDHQSITADSISEYAWINANSEHKTQPVGMKLPNAWGLYDMHGNVWEWCNDHFSCEAYQTLKEKDPRFRGDGTEAVFRGGCWDLEAQFSRAAFRGGNLKTHKVSYVGFRIVRELRD
jgi:formylglycine-generating enzyme required for sulfatase activity